MTTVGNNGVTEDVLLSVVREQAKIEGQIAELSEKKKGLRKKLKAQGVTLSDFDVMYDIMIKGGSDEYMERLRARRDLFRTVNLPVGHQFDFLEEIEQKSVEAAFAQGYQAFVRGDWEEDVPYEPGSPEGQEWIKGYREAQEKAAAGWKKLEAQSKPEESEDPEEDEEDNDASDDDEDYDGEEPLDPSTEGGEPGKGGVKPDFTYD